MQWLVYLFILYIFTTGILLVNLLLAQPGGVWLATEIAASLLAELSPLLDSSWSAHSPHLDLLSN